MKVHYPSFSCHRLFGSARFLSQALERTPAEQSPTGVPWAQQPAGPQSRPARSAHRGGCGLGLSLRGHVTAAIRAAGYGLPPSLLAAVTYRRPAPPTHRPHYDRYARVTGSCGGAAPTPGKLRAARELLYSPAADRVALQRRLPSPASGEGQAGWGGHGACRGRTEPSGALATGNSGRPAETPACAALLWPLHWPLH